MSIDLDGLEAAVAKASPLIACEHKANRPNPRVEGERIIGFVLDEETAGLGTGLLMLDAVADLAKACPTLISELRTLRAEKEAMREEQRDALIDAYKTGAIDVHEHWAAGNVEKEADFNEAASDYADDILARQALNPRSAP